MPDGRSGADINTKETVLPCNIIRVDFQEITALAKFRDGGLSTMASLADLTLETFIDQCASHGAPRHTDGAVAARMMM